MDHIIQEDILPQTAVGYRHLDTAEICENEEAVARGIRDAGVPREELFLTTKARMEDLSPAGLQRHLEGSPRRLDTDSVDLWLIPWRNAAYPFRNTLATMSGAGRESATGATRPSKRPSGASSPTRRAARGTSRPSTAIG
jgi:diketogulonate reductase-like aldo/keto reductase